MRFLFVLASHVNAANDVLAALNIADVEVVSVGKRERAIPETLLKRITAANDGIVLCGIDRAYRTSIGALNFDLILKKFRTNDQQLNGWLSPPPPAPPPEAFRDPLSAFRDAANRQPRFRLANNALREANNISNHRWRFASLAASILERQASGESLGQRRDWGKLHGVAFAVSGKVEFVYQLPDGSRPKSEWHLKEGDGTTAEAAARVYFTVADIEGLSHVLVAYVGPHPKDGRHEATF